MSKYKTPKPYLGYTTLPDVKTTERMKVDGKMRNLRVPVAKSADFEKLHAFADESTALLEKRNADPILSNITVPHTPSKSEYSFTSKALSNYQPWENDPRLETLGQTIDDNNSKLQRREGLVKKAEKRIREHRKNLFELNLKYPNTDIAKLLSPKIQEKLDKDISVYQQYYDDYSTLYTETTGIVDEYNSILGKEKERRTAWESTVMPIEELLDFYDSYVGEGSSNKRLLNDPIATPEQKERARAEIDLYTSQLGDSLYLFTQSEDFKNMGDLTDDERGKLRKEIKNLPILGSIWDLMNTPSFYITDDELKTYKYLKKLDRYNERTAANGFIEYMMPIWEARAVQGGAEKIEALPAVIEQGAKLHNAFGSGLYSWGQGVYSYLTGDQADPTIAQRIHQTTTANASAPGKVIYSLTESAGNLLPSLLLSKGAGMLSSASSAKKGIDTLKAADKAVKIGKAVGGVSMGLSAAGNAYSKKLAEGWSKDKARAYGTIVGISEVTLENVLGGITAVGGGKISTKAASKINAIRRTTPRIAAKLAVTGLSEATEEGLQTLLEPLYSGIINNEKYTAPSAEEVLISAASGFLLGDVMEFGTTVSADRNQALDTDIVNEYIEKGKKAKPGTVSRIMSDKISGILAENPDAKFSARDIGIIARMSKGDAKLKKNSTGTTSETSNTKVQGSDIANLFTPAEGVVPNVAKPSPAEAPAVPGANAEGVTTTLPETNAEPVTHSDPSINIPSSTDAVPANTQTVKKFNYETPTVSRIMSDKISGILAENPDAKFSARDIGIIARMSKGDTKLKKNSTGTTSETSDTKVQGSDIANLFTPAEEVDPNVAKPSPAEAPAVPGANAEGVTTTLPETNAEPVTHSDPSINIPSSTDAVPANTQTVKKFNYETPTVSRDGIEIKPESDPKIQKRLEGVTDDIERSGILSGASDDTISQVKQLSKAFKTKILFEVTPKITDEKGNVYTKNGRYNAKERTIYINMASDVMPVEQLVSHEFVHSIENTELYSTLKKYAQKFYKKTTGKGSFEKEAARIFKEYQDSGEATNYRWHDAEAEVVANYVADKLLNSTENIEEFVKENRSLAEKLKAIIDKVLSVIGTRETKDAAKLRRKLYKASKLLESAIRNRDIQANTKTNTENDILTNLSELRKEINEGKITEKEYETRLEQLDKEAASQGIDLNELMKGNSDKHSISKTKAKTQAEITINYQNTVDDILNGVHKSNPDIRYSITKKATEKKIDEGIEARPVADRLPREGIRKLREIEKGVRNKIGDIYKLRYARVNELQPAVRKVTEQYLANGEITDTDVDELLKFIETTFGNVSNTQDRNQVKYVLNEMIKGDLKYVKKAFDTIDKKVNSEPEWVKITREQRAKDFANKSMREFRNWAIDTFSLSKQEKTKLEELLTNLINSVSDGQISDKTFNSLFDYLYNSGIVKNSEKKNQYPTVYSYLKKNKFTVSDDVKNNIPDYDTYKDFREDSQGHISLGNDGISITEAYEFLNSIAPELFPDDIEGEGYQAARILEVAQDLKPAKEWAFQDATDEEKRQIRKEYEENINNFVRNATIAVNYARGSATVEQESEIESSDVDVEKLVDIMEQMKAERQKANAARGKVILTEQEENIVRDLLNGSRPIEDIPDSYNKKDIIAVYEASKEYERLRTIVQKEKAMIRQKRYDRARKYLADGDVLSGFRDRRVALMYMLNPMERNLRYIGKRSQLSEDLIDAYIAPIKRANRMSILYKNSIVRKIEKLDISRKVKSGNTHSEAFAVQFVGEAESNIKYLKKLNDERATKDGYNLDEWKSMLDNFWLENTKIDRQKIHDAVDTFHEIYDELFKRMNEARVRNGYEPISYRRDYFPHFNPKASNDILAMFGKTLGLNIEFAGLPADINGLTQNFRPGIRYFANAEQRLGYETVFDAVEGLHRYLDGAMDVIYQTDNICNLRALSQQIRYQASDEGMKQREDEIRARTDLDETEIKAVLDAVHKEGKYTLSGFVNDLEEYTNLLAGKKSKWDRGVEALLGRNIYQFMKSVTGKIAANMIAWNVASWLTNFIPLVQGATGLETKYMLYGMGTGLVGLIKNDGFEARSDFLTTRRGSDDLLKMYELTKAHSTKIGNAVSKSIIGKVGKTVSTAFDKSAELGMKPMEWIDMFVAHTLVRGRYQQNLSKGFDETTAMQEADKWAAGVMADRSKGGLPTIFGASNPVVKLVTQFQVETANQIGYFYSDVMNKEFRESTARAITSAILKYLIGAWIYNELYEMLTGRRPALDPANIVNEALGDFTGKSFNGIDDIIVSLVKREPDIMSDVERLPLNKATSELTANILEDVPFVGGLIGGGRIPIKSAIPDLVGLWNTATSDAPAENKKEKWEKELGTLATYYVLPGGGGQIAKTVKGISATNEGGKYSVDSKGREILQYPITPSPWTYIQSSVFGPTATEGGREWIESGFKSLNWEQTKAYKAMVNEGLTQDKAFDVIDGIRNAGDKKVDKVAYLNKADVSQNYKRAAYKEMFLPDSKKVILSAINDVGDYEDVVIDFMLEHPEANSKKEIMAIWGDFNSNGHLITNDKTLTPREKAAIIQVVADAKENPYWTKLKESVYYVVHPEEKIEDEEREKENQKKKRR